MRSSGFTLIEILVSIAIFGIVMLAILNLQNGTIQTTSNVINASDRLADQTLATSYIADRFRGARVITGTTTTALSLGSTTTCSNAATSANPCIAFITPETTYGDASGAMTRYVHLAYRYEARTGFADRQPDVWADTNGVEIIREYRRELKDLATSCPTLSACTPAQITAAAASAPSASSGLWVNTMLADGFTRVATTGTFSPWTISGEALQIRIRSLYKQSGASKYFPGDGPTTLQVLKRN